jgi:KaiC/GvpD/RAD55 family RecA-like ATPase
MTSSSLSNIERVPTGIHGLDDLLEGGIPEGRIVVLTGSAGSGKTTFGMQFLQHGIAACDEPGVYVTLEEEAADLYEDMGRYGWDLNAWVQQKKLALLKSPIPFEVDAPLSVDALLDQIHRAVTQVNAKRLVFDSVAALGLPYTNMVTLRRDVLRLCAMLRELGCTTLLTTEMPDSENITRFGIEQFVAQGAIVLHVAQTYRGIEIRKMRGTKHDTNIHRMRITDRGLVVSPGEHPF